MNEMKKNWTSSFNPLAVRGLKENGLAKDGAPILKKIFDNYLDESSSGIGKV
jgi:hypothetical protein